MRKDLRGQLTDYYKMCLGRAWYNEVIRQLQVEKKPVDEVNDEDNLYRITRKADKEAKKLAKNMHAQAVKMAQVEIGETIGSILFGGKL